MKTHFITFFLLGFSLLTYSQDTLVDPYVNIKNFITLEYGVGLTNTSNQNVNFGNYKLVIGKHSPTFNVGQSYTKAIIIKDPILPILIIKTGWFMNDNYTDVTDSLGKVLTFSELNLTCPIMIGVRLPVNYNRPQDRFFKACNLKIGGYVSLPLCPILYDKSESAFDTKDFLSDYIKFGLIAEFVFTALNKQGKGHRIGIRAITDMSVITFKNEKYGIQPIYGTIGLFYNLMTF